MRPVIIALSNMLAITAAFPYIRDTLRGRTKPRVVSWFVWAALTGIGAAAAFSQHQYPAGIFAAVCALQCLLVALIGFKLGDRKLTVLDGLCLAGAVAGLIVLVVQKSPALAITIVIATDFVGGIPTLQHAWVRPGEETASTYLLNCAASLLTACIADVHVFSSYAYPIYLLLFDGCCAVIILAGRHRKPLLPARQGALSVVQSVGPATGEEIAPQPLPSAEPPATAPSNSPPVLGSAVWSENPVMIGQLTTAIVPIEEHAGETAEAEYFIGADPGPGKGNPVSITAACLVADITVPEAGAYGVILRAKNRAGHWSAPSRSELVVR